MTDQAKMAETMLIGTVTSLRSLGVSQEDIARACMKVTTAYARERRDPDAWLQEIARGAISAMPGREPLGNRPTGPLTRPAIYKDQ